MTGHREQPNVQQQKMHPQKSHRKLTGMVLRSTAFSRRIVSPNSSAATLPVSCDGNSASKRLFSPNLNTTGHWQTTPKQLNINTHHLSSLYRYRRKSLPFFCSSLTTGLIWTKFGTAIAPRKIDSGTKFQLAAFLYCWKTVHEIFLKQQKLVKQVKN